jgi:hypothetical protein
MTLGQAGKSSLIKSPVSEPTLTKRATSQAGSIKKTPETSVPAEQTATMAVSSGADVGSLKDDELVMNNDVYFPKDSEMSSTTGAIKRKRPSKEPSTA